MRNDVELSSAERAEVELLKQVSSKNEFDKHVAEWVRQPDEDGSGQRVFFSPELAERTNKSLARLIYQARRLRDKRYKGSSARREAQALVSRLDRLLEESKKTLWAQQPPRYGGERRRVLMAFTKLYERDWARFRREAKRGADLNELVERMRAEKSGEGDVRKVSEHATRAEAFGARDEHRRTLEALGIAGRHNVFARQAEGLFVVYVRDE